MEDLKHYLNNHYGRCNRVTAGDSCKCMMHGWLGVKCFDWSPFDVSNYEELKKVQNETEWEKCDAKRKDE